MRKQMKNNKGITLTSLVIYIAIIFVVVATLMRVTTHFSNNMKDSSNVEFETQFNKLNLYLLDETKKMGNNIKEISEDGVQLTFTNGNKYTYNEEKQKIYFNNTIKICEGVEKCVFAEKKADNGKPVLEITIKIQNIEKILNYVITSGKVNSTTTLLPSEYQQVEYIESTGTQYINTLVKANDRTEIQCKFSSTGTDSKWIGIFGQRNGSDINALNVWLNNGFYYVGVGNRYPSVYKNDNSDCDVILNSKNIIINGENVSLNGEVGISNSNIFIFAIGTSENTPYNNKAYAKFYNFKIYEDGKLIRDYVPCKRNEDSAIGMYDLVNDVFYTNAGTGTFQKGADVIVIADNGIEDYINEEDYIFNREPEEPLLPVEYQQVEYIQSTGTQYINTLFIPNNNTSIEMKASNSSTTNACLYCARGSGHTNTYTAFLLGGNSLRVDYYNTTYSITTTTRETVYVYKQNKNLVYVDDALLKTISETEFSSGYNMYLLAAHNKETGISNIGNVKLYYCKIWDGDTLVRDLIPCYRISDSVVGIYDTVNDVFYTNAGTGAFQKGADIN